VSDDDNYRLGAAAEAAIEDAYIALELAHRESRSIAGESEDPAARASLVELQDATTQFFEVLRPYLKGAPGLREYWQGALATHPDTPHDSMEGVASYYFDNSTGVWDVSPPETLSVPVPGQAAAGSATAEALPDGGVPDSLADWHDALSLPPTDRVVSIRSSAEKGGAHAVDVVRCRVVGLRGLDDWTIGTETIQERGSGFMASEVVEKEVPLTEPAGKITTAKRMLVEVADELGALAALDTVDEREAEYDYEDLI